jgi:hypothetical protein
VDLRELDRLPSLWRINRMVLTALLAAVIGPITPGLVLSAAAAMHRRLANTRRKRRPAVVYPLVGLF